MSNNMLCSILQFLLLNLTLYASADCTYTTINTRQHQVVFKYAREHRSERDLPICGPLEVCSVLHKRFWLPPLAERLCRCGTNEECPWKWSNNSDHHTMFLNSRSQLKFCNPVNTVKQCNSKDTALTARTTFINSNKTRYTVLVRCHCSDTNYWRHYKTYRGAAKLNHTVTYRREYKCTPLGKCGSGEFCGHVRTDQNSIFYRCSCPEGHYCIDKDHETHNVEELMYKGSAYRAVCEPQFTNADYIY